MRPSTPRGFRDVLSQEAAERRAVSSAMLEVFRRWGYGLVETPVVEEAGVLEAGGGPTLTADAFRLIDRDGSLLALRPEMTLPIARVVSTRLASGGADPQRLCYVAPVFRERASLRGEARQFTQIGVELVGINGALSDAEVVGALVEAIEAAGLPEFTVGVGTVSVLSALLDAAGGDEEWRGRFMRAAQRHDLVGIDRLAAEPGLTPAAADALTRVPRIAGSAEAIAECRAVAHAAGCGTALDTLADTWELLEAAGMSDRLRIDFGILRSFDYYTGLVVEAYAPGLGLPLGGGGRYDDVLAAFDTPMPAAGFALSLERLQIALDAQNAIPGVPALDGLIDDADPRAAFVRAAELRGRGLAVCIGSRKEA